MNLKRHKIKKYVIISSAIIIPLLLIIKILMNFWVVDSPCSYNQIDVFSIKQGQKDCIKYEIVCQSSWNEDPYIKVDFINSCDTTQYVYLLEAKNIENQNLTVTHIPKVPISVVGCYPTIINPGDKKSEYFRINTIYTRKVNGTELQQRMGVDADPNKEYDFVDKAVPYSLELSRLEISDEKTHCLFT